MSEDPIKKAREIFSQLESLSKKNPRFKMEAFSFVMTGLNFTSSKLPKRRHLTGQELSEGIRKFSLQEFGPLARTVLEYWGLFTTEDIGTIVFILVEAGLLFKNEEDNIQDFENVYNFEKALGQDYWKDLRKSIKFQPILKAPKNSSTN
jgi:uncharacterized repeat protein (TIGR04138 family)